VLARLEHAEVLNDAMFRYDPALAPIWTPTFVLAPVDYSVLVPGELLPFCVERGARLN